MNTDLIDYDGPHEEKIEKRGRKGEKPRKPLNKSRKDRVKASGKPDKRGALREDDGAGLSKFQGGLEQFKAGMTDAAGADPEPPTNEKGEGQADNDTGDVAETIEHIETGDNNTDQASPGTDDREEQLLNDLANAVEEGLSGKGEIKLVEERDDGGDDNDGTSRIIGSRTRHETSKKHAREATLASIYGTNSLQEMANKEASLPDATKNDPGISNALQKQREYLIKKTRDDRGSFAQTSESLDIDPRIVAEEKKKMLGGVVGKRNAKEIENIKKAVKRQAKGGYLGKREPEVKAALDEILETTDTATRIKRGEELENIGHQGVVAEPGKDDYNGTHKSETVNIKEKIGSVEEQLQKASRGLDRLKALFAENIDLKKIAAEREKLRG